MSEATKFVIPSKKIFIAIPTYTGGVSGTTDHSLLRAATEAHKLGWTTDKVTREADSCIQRARCYLFTYFLMNTDCTDMLFVDADIGFTAEGFVKLMSYPVDVVGGAYRARGIEEHYILRPLANELQRKPPHGLMEVEGVGTGFLRITRRAGLKIVASMTDAAAKAKSRADELNQWLAEFIDRNIHDDAIIADLKRIVADDSERAQQHWYTDPTCPNMTVKNAFEFTVTENRLNSEDYNFCRLWRAIGGQVWVDPDQVLDHVGYTTFRGCLMSWLEKQMPRIPASVPQGGAAEYVKQLNGGSMLDVAKGLVGDAA